MPPEDAIRLERYEVIQELGRGGMATVHLARQLDLDRLVALKRLHVLAHSTDARVRRFVQEARLAASLSHSNIVTVHEAFEADGVPYIAMEFVPGGTLRELIPGLSPEQITGVLDGVLAGLTHAERRHIVHRDLKPENLLVTAEGAIKITDFGIAKATSEAQGAALALTTAGVAIGTPRYMAPEQVLGEEVGPRTDLYALGVIAFELLSGRPPFGRDGDTSSRVLMQHVTEAPPLDELRAKVDDGLAAWVTGLLAKAPDDRPPNAAAARDQLEDIVVRLRGPRWRRAAPLPFLGGPMPAPEVRARPPVPAPRVARPTRRPRTVPRAIIASLIGGAAIAAIVLGATTVAPRDANFARSGAPLSAPTAAASPAVAGAAATAATAAPQPADPASAPTAVAAAVEPIDPIRLDDAERDYRRFSEEAQDTEGDGDEALTQLLRDTASAYREAVTAGAAGDGARAGTALDRADRLAREATLRLDGD